MRTSATDQATIQAHLAEATPEHRATLVDEAYSNLGVLSTALATNGREIACNCNFGACTFTEGRPNGECQLMINETANRDLLRSPSMDDEFFTHLRFLEPEDAIFICKLRSDPKLDRHSDPSPIDVATQQVWIERYKEREAAGEEYYFVVNHQTTDYGVMRMYDFHRKSFSWGSWIILPSGPAGLVTYSAVMMYELAFETLGFEEARINVPKDNTEVVNFHLGSGAVEIDETMQDRRFVFPRAAWPAFRKASEPQIKGHRVFVG